MDVNLNILENARNADGNPFLIKRMPLPKPVITTMEPGDPVYDYLSTLNYRDGSTFPEGQPIKVIAAASYLNFIITNKCIIAQKYGNNDPDNPNFERDLNAEAILKELFPGRKVVFIDALAINLGGGGLHCISMQQPSYQNSPVKKR